MISIHEYPLPDHGTKPDSEGPSGDGGCIVRVSAIVPCHNAGRWIGAAVRSAARQTRPPYEIIVIDDSSTDDSLAQIESSGVPVKLLRVDVRNAAAARNAGIEAATGDAIALLDADDVWYPDHLVRAAELLEKSGDVAFMSNHDWISLDGEPIPIPPEHQCRLASPTSGMSVADYFRLVNDGFHFGHSTVVYRRDRVLEVGLFDVSQKRRHDLDLWLRVLGGHTWTYDTVKGAGYREGTPGSISKAELECDYYHLRCLTKNLPLVDGPEFRTRLAKSSRRAMGRAFTHGSPQHFAAIRELAWPHLPAGLKVSYSLGSLFPAPFRWLIQAKRRVLMGTTPTIADNQSPPAPTRTQPGHPGLIAKSADLLKAGLSLPWHARTYGRYLKYDARQHCRAPFDGDAVACLRVQCDSDGFRLPDLDPDVVGGLLALDVRASLAGSVLDPCLEFQAPGFHDSQYLERGVRGVRFFNVRRLLQAGLKPGEEIRLRGRHLTWRPESAQLFVCRERIHDTDRVLVVSPHPDDAEIAAFGLYADTNATVVTVTAGDGSDRYIGQNGSAVKLTQPVVARMRVWDSITIPQLGGLSPGKSINLCYPDCLLSAMSAEPDREFAERERGGVNFGELRRMNHSPLLRENAKCTWRTLIDDLAHVLEQVRPTVIVTPHPWLDLHPDHVRTTLAVSEALRRADKPPARYYFYTVHNRCSELWPFGPSGSGVAVLPILKDHNVECDGFYSHSLSAERQCDKYLALEAMHDLREMEPPRGPTARGHLANIRQAVTAPVHRFSSQPTSYLRRALRPDEIFFTATSDRGNALCERIAYSLGMETTRGG
jgi:glycosyltransferase involved in cell wall biosynthesis/LmbE family N-acetylglucosaminyl deacetylase